MEDLIIIFVNFKMATDFLVWGNNQSNLLSKSSSKCISTPMPMTIPFEITSICTSEKHVSFVTKDGEIYSYGTNLDGRLGVSTKQVDRVPITEPILVPINGKVVRAESGFSHMCVLTDKRELFSWGMGDYGALGTGEFKSRSTPTKVDLPKEIISNLRQISCGAMHSAFLTEQGDVYTCGSNEYGELGVNKPEKISTPVLISFHIPVHQISCGVFYTLLLTKQGKVYGMGNNKYGQLGIGHKVNECHPTLIRDLEGIVKVTAGYHSGAIDRFGNLFIWGSGSFGEILKPMKFVLSVPIRDIAIRGFFGLAIGHTSKNENRVYTWGNNTFGELGVGTYDASKEPIEVETLRGLQIGKIALGVNFAMVLLANHDRSKYQPKQTSRQEYQTTSAKKSVIGFEEGYLNSVRKRSQQRERHVSLLDEGRSKKEHSKNWTSMQSGYAQISPRITQRYETQRYDVKSSKRDYQRLFLTLSEDYEILVNKYSDLERQLQGIKSQEYAEREHLPQNLILKQEIARLNIQCLTLRDELRSKVREIEDLKAQVEKGFIIKNTREAKIPQSQLEQEYNKLLNQKQQLINKLTSTLNKSEEDYKYSLDKLHEQNIALNAKLNAELQANRKTNETQQNLQQQLQIEIKRLEQRGLNLKEENQILKSKILKLEDQLVFTQKQNFKVTVDNERVLKQQFEGDIKESYLKNQVLLERVAELEVELNYEKEFNRKYEGSMEEFHRMKEKLHKELDLQIDINKELQSKMDGLKVEVEKHKKYKKEADEKSIQLEEYNENFESYKRKTVEIIQDKQNQIAKLQQEMEKRSKQFSVQLERKQIELEGVVYDCQKLEKDIIKGKQNISALKLQISLKDEELQHSEQQRAGLEKKLTYTSTELNKQIEDREKFVKQIGEAKREIAKNQITISEIDSKYMIAREEKQKALKAIASKDQEAQGLKQELTKLTEKCENLRKENSLYREQYEDTSYKLEEQTKINDELTRANREFAENQSDFTRKINDLQNRVYELEDENKSYTPRYEALLIRNKELDQRNRQLGEMINKAIEIQAESYKTNILKEVEVSTDNFLNQVREEQQFQFRGKRNKSKSKEMSKNVMMEEEGDETYRNPMLVSAIKEEPYTKMMKERISEHKRKVSESAQKLANLLDIDEKGKKDRNFSALESRRTEDYQKINEQMQSFNNQKEQFMSKIHNFAEKLKIL